MHCAVCRSRSNAIASSLKTWLTADGHLLWIEVVLLSKLIISFSKDLLQIDE